VHEHDDQRRDRAQPVEAVDAAADVQIGDGDPFIDARPYSFDVSSGTIWNRSPTSRSRDLEDRRLRILVDRHDRARVLDAGEMLDRAGIPDREVQLRAMILPVWPTCMSSARNRRRPQRATRRRPRELVSERVDDLEVLARCERATAGDDAIRCLQIGRSICATRCRPMRVRRQLRARRDFSTPRTRMQQPAGTTQGAQSQPPATRSSRPSCIALPGTSADRIVRRVTVHDVGDLRHAEQRGDARHQVLAERRPGPKTCDAHATSRDPRSAVRARAIPCPFRRIVELQHPGDAGELAASEATDEPSVARTTTSISPPTSCAQATAFDAGVELAVGVLRNYEFLVITPAPSTSAQRQFIHGLSIWPSSVPQARRVSRLSRAVQPRHQHESVTVSIGFSSSLHDVRQFR